MRATGGLSSDAVDSAEAMSRSESSALIEAILLQEVFPSPAVVLQARRNAEARMQLLSEFGGSSRGEIGEGAGGRAVHVDRWKQEGRIFSVSYRGEELFPGFQFNDRGEPREVMRKIITVLCGCSSWELALWFIAANGWLNGRRPVDLLDVDPEADAVAARQLAAGVVF